MVVPHSLVTLKAPGRMPSPEPESRRLVPRTMGMSEATMKRSDTPSTACGASRNCRTAVSCDVISADMAAKKPSMARRPLMSSGPCNASALGARGLVQPASTLAFFHKVNVHMTHTYSRVCLSGGNARGR